MPDEDRDTSPGDQTEPHPPPSADTDGSESVSDPDKPTADPATDPELVSEDAEPTAEPVADPELVTEDEAPSEPVAVPAQPVAVTDSYQYLKRWTFVLVVGIVWILAAVVGVAVYYWWYHSLDKTPAVFVVLVFLVVCTVSGLIAAMVQNKPLISALAIALVSAPFAATAGAAVLHGLYFCEYARRCLVGLIPY